MFGTLKLSKINLVYLETTSHGEKILLAPDLTLTERDHL